MNRAYCLGIGLVVALTGCVGKGEKDRAIQSRSQVADDPAADKEAFATVGMKTAVGNTEPIPVSGVGLVYNLAGTGSTAQPGGWRTMLEAALKKQGYPDVRRYLDNPTRTTSLVLVSAVIPPGARKGDPIDVLVTLPDGSKTTSLKGGKLLPCDLVSYDTAGNVRASLPDQAAGPRPGGNQLLMGSAMATAAGPLLAGTLGKPAAAPQPAGEAGPSADTDPDDNRYRAARIWGGGRCQINRPYYLLLNEGWQNARNAMQVAERLNATFQANAEPNQKVAEAKNRDLLLVTVPPAYRHNHFRFLLVARQVPLVPVSPDSPYRRKIEDELLAPATALTAALKLEALGGESRRPLRQGLESQEPWVRFAAAEALAYLGQTDGTAELAKLAEQHPGLRAQCLKALASLDDGTSTDRLTDLMACPDPELRYGAFVALRLADENNRAAAGRLLNNSFWLHRVAPGSPGMAHVLGDRRSEIVLFGDGPLLTGPFTLPVGSEFTVSMPAPGAQVKVSRILRVKGENEVKEVACAATVADVIATVATLGGGYPEAVELLRRADRAQVLSTPLAFDAAPRELSVQQLVALARTDTMLRKADAEVARVGTVGPDTSHGLDLPPEEDAEVKPAEAPARPALNREPGRLFGPRRPSPEPAAATDEAIAAPIPEPAPVADADEPAESSAPRNRSPGRLFGGK